MVTTVERPDGMLLCLTREQEQAMQLLRAAGFAGGLVVLAAAYYLPPTRPILRTSTAVAGVACLAYHATTYNAVSKVLDPPVS